jgi:catechol 2,3-dioxygenase-like lactoylglutathione lyase family enzyme
MKPEFEPGRNIALKVPSHEYEKTLHFYEHILGLNRIPSYSPDQFETVTFEFGDKNLWIDKIAGLSQSEVWLEIETDNAEAAKHYLSEQGFVIRDEIEPLPEGLKGFWLSGPNNIIHLVVE